MPTDAGIVTRKEVAALLGPSHIFSGITRGLAFTIEQFAEALQRVLINPDPPCWSNEHCPCANCNARRLLAAYDGKEAGHVV